MGKKQTVLQALADAVESEPDKIFLIEEDKTVSFKQFDEITDRLASAFFEKGIKKGDKISIIALNQVEWLYTFFAATKIGVTVVPLNTRYRETELEYMLNQAEVKAVISLAQFQDFDYVKFFQSFRSRIPGVSQFFYIGGNGEHSFEKLLECEPEDYTLSEAKEQVDEEDTVLIIYTSGTTGKPKGAMITNRSLLASARAQSEHLNISKDDIAIGSLPLNHVGGITCTIMVGLVSMSSVVLVPNFRPDRVVDVIERYKATIFGGVPTMYLMMLSLPHLTKKKLTSLKICIVGGSNVEPKLCCRITNSIPNAKLINLYGLSETSGACVLSRLTDNISKVQETIGVPIGTFKAKVVDRDGAEVSNGVIGELFIQGDCVAKGYYGMKKETNETFQHGWLATGDMVYKDDEGYLHFKGRKKEMYITGGFNVFPVEIENVLASYEKVQLAAGIGVPDPLLGEIGVYYIVPKPNVSLTEEELFQFCRDRLADYKVPKRFIIVDEVPLTPAGKVQKSKLMQRYLETNRQA
ncbi:AMP-binding protein [Geobacillus sp. 46C-IIa]|uniref:class I adenylate-forming enzyme family protein n=1 Tax=Geobacillus sp. 46C-IIa TaxID=1963025 RepID=UPI001301C210|nr:AMP-binding protein [Geobacillus sp. 46C-IIa]QNU29293.1 AMP-binding protein [Geobacillus sp. 46C-IIa]